MFLVVVVVVILVVVFLLVKGSDKQNRSENTSPTKGSPETKRVIDLPDDAYSMVEKFAQMVNAVVCSDFFYPSDGLDSINIILSCDEGESEGYARLALYTDYNLKRLAEYSGIEFNADKFKFDSDDTFLYYESNSVKEIDSWLGISTAIQIAGKEHLAAKKDSLSITPLIATLKNNMPNVSVSDRGGTGSSFYFAESKGKYVGTYQVFFNLHRQ